MSHANPEAARLADKLRTAMKDRALRGPAIADEVERLTGRERSRVERIDAEIAKLSAKRETMLNTAAHAARVADGGEPIADVAREVGVSVGALRRWVAMYLHPESTRLADRLTDAMKAQSLTGTDIADRVEQLTGVRPDPMQVSRWLSAERPLLRVSPDLYVLAEIAGLDPVELIVGVLVETPEESAALVVS